MHAGTVEAFVATGYILITFMRREWMPQAATASFVHILHARGHQGPHGTYVTGRARCVCVCRGGARHRMRCATGATGRRADLSPVSLSLWRGGRWGGQRVQQSRAKGARRGAVSNLRHRLLPRGRRDGRFHAYSRISVNKIKNPKFTEMPPKAQVGYPWPPPRCYCTSCF